MSTNHQPASSGTIAAPKQHDGRTCPVCEHDLRHVELPHPRLGPTHSRTGWVCGNTHCERYGEEVSIR